MSSISVQPTSGPSAVSSVKPGNSTDPSVTTNETAKSPSAAQSAAAVLYPSPVQSIDPATSRLIIEYRDSANGEEEYQIPSKTQLRLYQESQSHGLSDSASTGEQPAETTTVA